MIVCIRSVGIFDANKKDGGRGESVGVFFMRTKKKGVGGGEVEVLRGGDGREGGSFKFL